MSSVTSSPSFDPRDINEAVTQLNVMVITLKELGVKRTPAIEDADSFDALEAALREAPYPQKAEMLAAVAECRAEITEFTGDAQTTDRCFKEVWGNENLAEALPLHATSRGKEPGGRTR